jgi:hypothetical protein
MDRRVERRRNLERRLPMKDPYFAIRLIRQYGGIGAGIMAVFATAAAAGLLWASIGWMVVPVAAAVGALAFLVVRSYVELVSLVFERLN